MTEAGSGGMGMVAEAVDTLLERRVAIKFLHQAEGAEARSNLIREARAMAGLRHRSICRVLEIAIDPPPGVPPERWRPFLVLEWAAGTRLDRRAERPTVDLFSTAKPRDGSPFLVAGLLTIVATLAVLATFVPEWFRFGPLDRDEAGEILRRPGVTTRAAAFLVSGVPLFGLSLALGVRATPLADRCSRALRWIVPSFVLIPIAWLEIEETAPGWGFWLATLVVVSLGLVALSSTLQWRPFLLSGLLGLLDAVVRGFIRIDRHLEDPALARIGLMTAVAIVGITIMVFATYPERPLESLRTPFRRTRSASG